jgi:hypothetical protein
MEETINSKYLNRNQEGTRTPTTLVEADNYKPTRTKVIAEATVAAGRTIHNKIEGSGFSICKTPTWRPSSQESIQGKASRRRRHTRLLCPSTLSTTGAKSFGRREHRAHDKSGIV